MRSVPNSALEFARMIDFSFLKPSRTYQELEHHCQLARQYNFGLVSVHPADVDRCIRLLRDSPVKVGSQVGFPLGLNTVEVKEYEASDAIQRGAHEIDMVINIRALLSGEFDLVRQEIASVARLCQAAGIISKVILETCYLDDAQKRIVCRIALEEGADFVKSSTGFGPAGATVTDIRLMREVVGDRLGVKAAGGITNLKIALEMIAAGANRLGTSSGIKILKELRAQEAS